MNNLIIGLGNDYRSGDAVSWESRRPEVCVPNRSTAWTSSSLESGSLGLRAERHSGLFAGDED